MPRCFVLQLVPGVPSRAKQEPEERMPLWQCTGCLVFNTSPRGQLGQLRPEGQGCGERDCTSKSATWCPVNRWAKQLDKALGRDPDPTLFTFNHDQQAAARAIIHAIEAGAWARLTRSCEPHIIAAVNQGLKQELAGRGAGKRTHWTLRFDYNSCIMEATFWDRESTMVAGYSYMKPAGAKEPSYVVRFRWFQ